VVLARLERLSPSQRVMLCGALVPALGALDYLTGTEYSFAAFYLIPIAIGAWSVGRRAGWMLSLAAAVSWLLANGFAGQPVPAVAIIPWWNAVVRFALFLAVALSLSSLRTTMDALRESLSRERELARLDPLTGVANPRAFRELAAKELARSARFERPLALLYVDADGFKQVNDTQGHAAGDEVLRRVGMALRSQVRMVDVVARIGGDEFAVLLSETGEDGAVSAAHKLHEVLTAEMARDATPVTFSVGAVVAPGTVELDELVRAADHVMYEVKRAGKNHVRMRPFAGGA